MMDFDELPLSVPAWGTNGWGGADRYMDADLPAEPAAPAMVQVRVMHPVFGLDPVFLRLVQQWLPLGWIPARAEPWAVLCGWDADRHPQLLVEVAS